KSGEGGGKIATEKTGGVAADERPESTDAEGGPGGALTSHGGAVDTGDDRRSFARNIDQDRRGRTAVLRAVGDAEQHNQVRQRRRVQRQRQKQRNRACRTESRQYTDQRTEQYAEKSI